MKKIEYDEDIDLVNIEIFARTGTNDPTEKRYRCSICKQPVCINDSFSSKGHKLFCYRCLYTKFDGSYAAALDWQEW